MDTLSSLLDAGCTGVPTTAIRATATMAKAAASLFNSSAPLLLPVFVTEDRTSVSMYVPPTFRANA